MDRVRNSTRENGTISEKTGPEPFKGACAPWFDIYWDDQRTGSIVSVGNSEAVNEHLGVIRIMAPKTRDWLSNAAAGLY